MLRRLLQLGAALAAVLLAVAVGLYVYVRTLDLNSYKPVIENAVLEATGHVLRIEGDLDAVFSLLPTLGAKGVTLANASWSDEPYLARVSSVEISVDLWPLLSGQLEILRIALADVRVVLEKNARGEPNWVLEPRPREEPQADPLEVHLRRLELDDVSLVYRDAASGLSHDLFIESLRMTEPPLLERLMLELDAVYAGEPVQVKLVTGPVADLVDDRPVSISLSATSRDTRLDVEGSIERPRAANGLDLVIGLSTPDIASLSPLAGRSLPATQTVDGSLRITDAEGEFRLSEIEMSVGGSDLHGNLVVAVGGERPRVSGRIESRTIDVLELLGPPDRAGVRMKPADGRLFSDESLPFHGLRTADVDLEIEIERLATKTVDLGSLSTHVVLEDGRLDVDPFTADIAEGTVTGTVRVDAASAPPAISIRSSASGVQLGLLIAALTESGLAERGPSDLDLDVRAAGGSARGLMASLDGFVLVSVGEGRIRSGVLDLIGADLLMELVDLVNPTVDSTDHAEVECAVLYLEIGQGVARSDKTIALETEKMNVTATGQIDLRNETLEMAVRPRAQKGVNFGASGLAEMVYIGGSLSEPSLSIDLKGVATQAATLTAAFATMGASLLAQNLLADKDPCKTALEKAGTRSPQRQSVAAGGAKPTPAPTPAKKSVAGEVKGFFDGLFGK